jgi:ubiquitin carboxyl-terminal hydrolase 36/42
MQLAATADRGLVSTSWHCVINTFSHMRPCCCCCPCVTQVKAYKRISIENAPNVLTVHLKRFDFFGRGHKVSKRVDFDTQLDLGPFMTSHLQRRHHHHIHKHKHHHHHPQQQQQQHAAGPQQQHHHHHGHHVPVMYDLYAVLVHHGHSLHSGHYVAFVKAGNGMWHHCDDHRVAPVSERMVEGQQAYILFYVRRQLKGSRAAAAAAVQAAASAAVAAAAAGNREQQRQLQREQLRQQKQQDSSKPGGAAAPSAAAAVAAGGGVSAGVQETGSVSAAEERKVVTSSTESTANASPADDADGQQQ